MAIALGIWTHRNNTIFRVRTRQLMEIGKFVAEYLAEYHSVNKRIATHIPEVLVLSWIPPPVGVYKANFDGALCSNAIASIEGNCSGSQG